jgi:ketosteroid isomerase-like protein
VTETPKAIVERYHDAWAAKDFHAARALLHDDLSFQGPIDTFERADDYLEALKRLAAMVEGVRVDKVVAEGDDVVVLHELTTPMGRAPVAEWYRVRGDKIGAVRVYFDARPFAPPA